MKLNQNYANLQESYLFLTIAKKVAAYTEAHPDNHIIRMGIGDVTQPLVPAVIEAMHKATDEMAHKETFRQAEESVERARVQQRLAELEQRSNVKKEESA